MVNPILPWITILAVLVLLRAYGRVGRLGSNIFLLTLFLFTRVALNSNQGTFYSLMLLGVFVMNLLEFVRPAKEGFKLGDFKYQGVAAAVAFVITGVVITVLFRFAVGGVGSPGSVIGVPSSLAVSSDFVNTMSPTIVSALGYVENQFFFGIGDTLKALGGKIPLLGLFTVPFVAPVVAAGLFAFFHIVVFDIALQLFAFLVFAFWVVTREFVGPEPANVSHYVHNGLETLPLGVSL